MRRLRRLPLRGGRADARGQIGALAAAAGKWCAIGSWAELGVATTANAHLAAASPNFPFANDTHYPLQLEDVLDEPVAIEGGGIAITAEPGLGVTLDPERVATLSALELRESPSTTTSEATPPASARSSEETSPYEEVLASRPGQADREFVPAKP